METFAKMSNFLDFMIHEAHRVDIIFSELSKSKSLKLKFVLTKRVCRFCMEISVKFYPVSFTISSAIFLF